MSRQRAKGTTWEVELQRLLSITWKNIARRGTTLGANDDGDYLNCDGVIIEAKKVDRPRFLEWARDTRTKADKAGHHRWVVMWAGDRRTTNGQPLAVMPLDYALDLIHSHHGPFGTVAIDARHARDEHITATLDNGEQTPTLSVQPTTGNEAA